MTETVTRDHTYGQFPSLDGDQPGEVAQRQPEDNDEGFFHKVFTVHNRAHTPGLAADHWWHIQNAVEVVSDAIRRGLHPKGDVELVGERSHPTDPNTTDVVYRVPVVPAIVDHDQTTTLTPAEVASWTGDGSSEPSETDLGIDTALDAPPVPAVPAAPLLH